MGNDILPPKRPVESTPERPAILPQPAPISPSSPLEFDRTVPQLHRPFYRKWQVWALTVLGLIVLGGLSMIAWYYWALQPVKSGDTSAVRMVVRSGESSSQIIETLAQKGLIRSRLATKLYVNISGQKQSLQAGGYVLSKNLGVSDIMKHIAEGKTDELNVTILPGLTLKELADPEVKGSLAQQGFSATEINQAFAASYNSPVLADKPAAQGLEGYLFPETYRMSAGDSLSTVVQKSLDELYDRLQSEGLISKFRARNLTIHQALTLASIVQKEVGDAQTQKQVAQVFYTRLGSGMVLGSDVTFAYAAAQLGVTPAVDIDSPYNTRRNPGLPPGPIANMNTSALEAVADPAPGDYVYFVAGDGADQGQTYFAHTLEEHQANIAAHCKTLCQ